MSEDPILTALIAILNRLDTVEAGQAQLRTDVLARFERIQNQITSIQDDIAVAMARADRTHEAVEGTRTDVRGLSVELGILWRQVKRQEADIRELKGEKP